mgnify:CR=1 FL=1
MAGSTGHGRLDGVAGRQNLRIRCLHALVDADTAAGSDFEAGILRELQRAEKSGNLKQRLEALQKAQKRLQNMASSLDRKAARLRKQAKAVKKRVKRLKKSLR